MKTRLFVSAATLLAVAVAGLALARGRQNQPPESQQARYEKQKAVVEAVRRGDLNEAARLNGGHYVGRRNFDTDWVSLSSLEQLTKYSAGVVVGVPTKNRCKLVADGRSIGTLYDVVAGEVLKGGELRQGEVIKVLLPGGKVKFKDGTTAEIETPNFEKMRNGRTYILYLSEHQGGIEGYENVKIYELTNVPQGMVELSVDGATVHSQAPDNNPLKRQIEGKDAKTFLTEARKIANEYPAPGKCCQ